MSFKPFANEADTARIGGLDVENRTDRVSIYGSLDLTRDKTGLAHARALKAILDGVIEMLDGKAEQPAKAARKPASTTVKNPFD